MYSIAVMPIPKVLLIKLAKFLLGSQLFNCNGEAIWSPIMSIIDSASKENCDYAKRYDPKLGRRLAPKIAIVSCMDPRLSNLREIVGLRHADIDVITREQIKVVRSHPWIAKDVPVRGFVPNVEASLLGEVQAVPRQTAA